ncbi:MAG: UbiX family flavin prenyltransferase [Bacillota bacterium]|jgi:4-hydroxy-3-polyprenylbenzoate decarboxylase
MRIIVGITGASGAVYGLRLVEQLKLLEVETHLVLSDWARRTIKLETGLDPDEVARAADVCYEAGNLAAPPASGSFIRHGMVVAPCSMKTLAAIACGFTDNLIVRAADVTLKEGRQLILLPRETPLNPIHLENMLKLARTGTVIMPPVPAFYHQPRSIDDIVLHTVGRVLDRFGLEHSLVKRWTGYGEGE